MAGFDAIPKMAVSETLEIQACELDVFPTAAADEIKKVQITLNPNSCNLQIQSLNVGKPTSKQAECKSNFPRAHELKVL